MTLADVPFALRLKEQADWNQTEADWLRFLDLEPQGCFVAELDGRAAGAVATCLFGMVAWISAVLVESSQRGRGIGTALTERALTFLAERGAQTVRLDATPMGQPIYEKLGFRTDYILASYVGVPQRAVPSDQVRPMRGEDLDAILALDRAVTGTDRQRLLGRLFAEHSSEAQVVQNGGRMAAYLMARPGTTAWRIGPCVGDGEPCRMLLEDACHRHQGQPMLFDTPLGVIRMAEVAKSKGLCFQRRLTRMSRGLPLKERVPSLGCSSGPEAG